MFKVTVKHYGSNGATCNQRFTFSVDTQEEIPQVLSEFNDMDNNMVEYTDHPKIKSATEISDRVLEAGGMATEFISITHKGQWVAPIPALVKYFEGGE